MIEFVIGLSTGILSGFGVGGGSLLMLYLTLWAGVEQFTAGGINLLYFLCCAPAALWSHIRHRLVDGQAVRWCVLAGAPLSVAAAYLASMADLGLLRRAFGLLLLPIGLREVLCRKKNEP